MIFEIRDKVLWNSLTSTIVDLLLYQYTISMLLLCKSSISFLSQFVYMVRRMDNCILIN